MRQSRIPANLVSLHQQEEQLRDKATGWIVGDERLLLHLDTIELAMDLADQLRQFDTRDEDLKVIQMLGMRAFNAFGASLKLTLSGYGQNGVLIMRNILETIFLIDLFQGNHKLIKRWRLADKKVRMKEFGPVKVREALDQRDGFTSKKRAEIYDLFCELAGHPTMKSVWMMRPQKDGNAVIGPFMEKMTLEAVISEMGRLAIQMGEQLNLFFPKDWGKALQSRLAFAHAKKRWIGEFYPQAGHNL